MSKVGTPPPHDSEIPHGLVNRNTTQHSTTIYLIFIINVNLVGVSLINR